MDFYVVSALRWGILYRLLRGLHMSAGHLVRIFTWYLHAWGALFIYIFCMVFA